jgi:alkanesulfonate monooxygenase SsuD/methylene tetrahydromethanopterin reductase-like flavin-dependent oxidoreductase (luciferase family)
MTDYGHDLLFGTFVTPKAQGADRVVDLAVAADRAGVDLVTFQDHPYQPAFLDTWTLMSYVAARTERVRITGNVLNLPLRPPAVLARAAASLDLLSGGRFELGLGAGAFWDGIEAMGGRRLTPAEGVRALREGIGVIRELWNTDSRGGVHHQGEFYAVDGAKRGPKPAHDIGVWVGAYKPKMLELTGAVADGWLPSMSYLPDGADSLPGMNARIDEAAVAAGRRPDAVRRLLNFMEADTSSSQVWAEQLASLALEHGISGFVIGGDDLATTERLGAEVAPLTRELVAKERGA